MGAALDQNRQFSYRRRQPERTLLYQTFARSLESWLAERHADTEKTSLPAFGEKELRAFLRCGILPYGLILVDCKACPNVDLVVGLSCKFRGFCPSCGAKRQAEVTAHLLDNVLPHTAFRQWVTTFPYQLRYWMATNRKLNSQVHKIVAGVITAYYERRAAHRGIAAARGGGVTFMQRFGSALNLNLHYHSLFIEGVFSTAGDKPSYFQLKGPSDDDVAETVHEIADKVISLLRRRKYLPKAGEDAVECEKAVPMDSFFSASEQLAEAAEASNTMHIAFGPRAGQPVRRIGKTFGMVGDQPLVKGRQCALVHGFTLHAARYIGLRERSKLEELVAYGARPAFAHRRLALKNPESREGDLVYTLKTAWKDGTTAIVLSHSELFEKLVSLIPQPYSHQTRYFGVLSSHSRWRRAIVLKPHIKKGFVAASGGTTPEKMTWAKLLKRTYKIDITRCPTCKLRIYPDSIQLVVQEAEIRLVLLMLELDPNPPPIRPPGTMPRDDDDEAYFSQEIAYDDD